MLGNIIGGRFRASKCPTWKFLIWNQQNLHIKENDQHLVQLLPNKLGSLFISVLLVSIKVFGVGLYTFYMTITHPPAQLASIVV